MLNLYVDLPKMFFLGIPNPKPKPKKMYSEMVATNNCISLIWKNHIKGFLYNVATNLLAIVVVVVLYLYNKNLAEDLDIRQLLKSRNPVQHCLVIVCPY